MKWTVCSGNNRLMEKQESHFYTDSQNQAIIFHMERSFLSRKFSMKKCLKNIVAVLSEFGIHSVPFCRSNAHELRTAVS